MQLRPNFSALFRPEQRRSLPDDILASSKAIFETPEGGNVTGDLPCPIAARILSFGL